MSEVMSDSTGMSFGNIRRIWGFPMMLLAAAINFFILSVIFVWTLYYKLRAQFLAGDKTQTNYMMNAFTRGIGYAFIAAVVLLVVDFISGGFASLVMIFVYPLAAVTMLVLSLIKPAFLNDITETINGEQVSRTSAYRLWSVSFWSIFVIGMIVALSLGALTAYFASKISRVLIDTIIGVTGREDVSSAATFL